jgi:peptidoglycan-N-acetylglucosamine deacetylase
MKAEAAAGHEIGIHGYSRENPIAMTPEQEEAVLKCRELVTKCCRAAVGVQQCNELGV